MKQKHVTCQQNKAVWRATLRRRGRRSTLWLRLRVESQDEMFFLRPPDRSSRQSNEAVIISGTGIRVCLPRLMAPSQLALLGRCYELRWIPSPAPSPSAFRPSPHPSSESLRQLGYSFQSAAKVENRLSIHSILVLFGSA